MAPISAAGRWLFSACLLLSWSKLASNVLSERFQGSPVAFREPLALNRLKLAVIAMSVVFVSAVVCFGARWNEGLAAATVIVLLAVLSRIEISQWPGDTVIRLGKYAPSAACLLGYLVAWHAARASAPAYREACAWEAACGVMAGIYFLTAISKAGDAGKAWFASRNLGLLMAERSYEASGALRRLRLGVAGSPWLCRLLATAALGVEVAGVLLAFPAARWPCIAALTLLQLGFALLMGFLQYEWILVTIALGFCSAGR